MQTRVDLISTSSGDTLRRKLAGALSISKGRFHGLSQLKQWFRKVMDTTVSTKTKNNNNKKTPTEQQNSPQSTEKVTHSGPQNSLGMP